MKTPWQIEALFERYPMLAGFSVRGATDIPDNYARTGDVEDLFVGDVGIVSALTVKQYAKIVQDISSALADLLSEQPESGEGLRGRTFARVLH
jgi:hypothetical protein